MTLGALILILAAAFIHATWNLLNKRASRSCDVYLAGGFPIGDILYAGVTRSDLCHAAAEIGIAEVVLMAGSAVLHSAYFILLNQGYRVGDLSLVYPLARGTGPLLSTLAAILLLGERPSALALDWRIADHRRCGRAYHAIRKGWAKARSRQRYFMRW